MSTEIYYFSGTGNSLHVAKELQRRIPEAKLLPITGLADKETVTSSGETVGFVFPHYASSLPKLVHAFIQKLDLGSARYLFAIATRGGTKTMAFSSFDFYYDEKCTGCGVCESVCLAEKVQLVGGGPVWQEAIKCHGCFACLNFCPEESIQVESKWYLKSYTDQNGRYHHPAITANDIAGQKLSDILRG